MASKNILYCDERNMTELHGSFATNGSSNPVSKTGAWFTVTRTGVGTFQVVTTRDFANIIPLVHLALGTPGNSFAQVGAITISAGVATFNITTFTAGAAADIAAATGNVIFLQVIGEAY